MNKLRLHLLKLLHENKGQYISGEKMSIELGVSRTAIWKHIKELREKGYEIDSRSNRGYALLAVADKIVPEEIYLNLKKGNLGQEIRYFNRVVSTNKKTKMMAVEGEKDGTIVIAEEQTAGRGRLGREWFSPPGTGLWFSLLLRPNFKPEKAPLLTVVASLAVADALECYGIKAAIKWPNDILINGKKVCGILSEMSADLDKINYAIIGIGINVAQKDFPDFLTEIATSLFMVTGVKVNRNRLLQQIISSFKSYYDLLLTDKTHKLINFWQKKLNIINKTIEIKSKGELYRGKAIGVSEKGELLLEYKNRVISFWAGDATLVKRKNK